VMHDLTWVNMNQTNKQMHEEIKQDMKNTSKQTHRCNKHE